MCPVRYNLKTLMGQLNSLMTQIYFTKTVQSYKITGETHISSPFRSLKWILHCETLIINNCLQNTRGVWPLRTTTFKTHISSRFRFGEIHNVGFHGAMVTQTNISYSTSK